MKYVGLYSDPQDIAVKKNVDAVADRVTTAEGEIDALQTAVDGKVPNTRKVNNKALSADITLTAADVGALPSSTVIPTVPDNLVTYAAGTTVEGVTGVDADTLQGHAASYFATQSGLTAANSSISTNANNITELSTKVSGVEGSISGIQTSVGTKLDKSGGTMTGALIAQNNANYATKQVRNIIISTADPSGGSNGDIWVKYTV